jgi:hypothetical protein
MPRRRRIVWVERVPHAFEKMRAVHGDGIRPKHIVGALAPEFPNLSRRAIARSIFKYIRRGPDGVYRLQSPRPPVVNPQHPPAPVSSTTATIPPTAGEVRVPATLSSTQLPPEVVEEFLRVRKTPLWKKLTEEAEFMHAMEHT